MLAHVYAFFIFFINKRIDALIRMDIYYRLDSYISLLIIKIIFLISQNKIYNIKSIFLAQDVSMETTRVYKDSHKDIKI
jgi:hypothetical protein